MQIKAGQHVAEGQVADLTELLRDQMSRTATLVFGITLYNESTAQLDWCLAHLRKVYSTAAVIVVTDGTSGYASICHKHHCDYVEGERLKPCSNGAKWWTRLLQLFLRYNGDFYIKLDADTQLHRPFAYFPSADVFGTRMWYGGIQGGIHGFSWAAIQQIMKTGITLDPSYINWGIDTGYCKVTGTISTELLLFDICKRLKLVLSDWAEVDSMPKKTRAWRQGVAATHPHKSTEEK